jgi:hypothetical protein
MPPSIQANHLLAYQNDAMGIRTLTGLAADGTGIFSLSNQVGYWDANGNLQNIFVPAPLASDIRAAYSRDYLYFWDHIASDLLAWNLNNGTAPVLTGLLQPVAPLTVGTPGSGDITLTTGRTYYTVFYDPVSQNFSDLSPASATTGPLTDNDQPLTAIPVSSQLNATRKKILATADGNDPTVLYELVDLASATTTYTDDTPETTLLLNNVWQYTDTSGVPHGVVGNQPPPNGSFPLLHQGRLWLADGNLLQFSKSLAEVITATGNIAGRYEMDWPPGNGIDISADAEQIAGLLTDGTTLYIGTELRILRLQGYNAQTFSEPNTLFSDVGLLWQDVWSVVYLDGTPVGTMWMTPDYRVMNSDFNTYQNVGVPIQTVLNTINPAAYKNAWAISPQLGPYSFYVLAIPTGVNTVPDTLCVYDMRLRKWYVWQGFDQFESAIFYVSISGTPRWIACDQTGTIRNFDPSFVTDRNGEADAVGITSTVQSTWLDFGDNMVRKSLNEMEVQTTDPDLEISVEGASTAATFETPVNILVTAVNPVPNAFGDLKVFLAGTDARDRFFQYTAVSTSNPNSTPEDIVLSEVSLEVLPMNRI